MLVLLPNSQVKKPAFCQEPMEVSSPGNSIVHDYDDGAVWITTLGEDSSFAFISEADESELFEREGSEDDCDDLAVYDDYGDLSSEEEATAPEADSDEMENGESKTAIQENEESVRVKEEGDVDCEPGTYGSSTHPHIFLKNEEDEISETDTLPYCPTADDSLGSMEEAEGLLEGEKWTQEEETEEMKKIEEKEKMEDSDVDVVTVGIESMNTRLRRKTAKNMVDSDFLYYDPSKCIMSEKRYRNTERRKRYLATGDHNYTQRNIGQASTDSSNDRNVSQASVDHAYFQLSIGQASTNNNNQRNKDQESGNRGYNKKHKKVLKKPFGMIDVSKEPLAVKSFHNENEKMRRKELFKLFQNLRCVVPYIKLDSKASKFKILTDSQRYINELVDEDKHLKKEVLALTIENKRLIKRLAQDKKRLKRMEAEHSYSSTDTCTKESQSRGTAPGSLSGMLSAPPLHTSTGRPRRKCRDRVSNSWNITSKPRRKLREDGTDSWIVASQPRSMMITLLRRRK